MRDRSVRCPGGARICGPALSQAKPVGVEYVAEQTARRRIEHAADQHGRKCWLSALGDGGAEPGWVVARPVGNAILRHWMPPECKRPASSDEVVPSAPMSRIFSMPALTIVAPE